MVCLRAATFLIIKWYNFYQKPVEHQTGPEVPPIQYELLFQDIDMLKSN